MTDKKLKLIYIDDDPELQLSQYLDQEMKEFDYEEIIFKTDSTYNKLVDYLILKNAKIVLIDSNLFEDSTVIDEKYSGEGLMLIMKRLLPYTEAIVISQNEDNNDIGYIKKFIGSQQDED
ncbi:MAG: hypothetical protein PHX46_02585 [Bacilli bacterium]|nr:hypothetical protein [Bacilli bacterium]